MGTDRLDCVIEGGQETLGSLVASIEIPIQSIDNFSLGCGMETYLSHQNARRGVVVTRLA